MPGRTRSFPRVLRSASVCFGSGFPGFALFVCPARMFAPLVRRNLFLFLFFFLGQKPEQRFQRRMAEDGYDREGAPQILLESSMNLYQNNGVRADFKKVVLQADL